METFDYKDYIKKQRIHKVLETSNSKLLKENLKGKTTTPKLKISELHSKIREEIIHSLSEKKKDEDESETTFSYNPQPCYE